MFLHEVLVHLHDALFVVMVSVKVSHTLTDLANFIVAVVMMEVVVVEVHVVVNVPS